MGCRKLEIYDYFRLEDTEKNEKSDMRFCGGIRKNAYGDFLKSTHGTMSELHTYRDGLTPDKTTWNYNSATGLLTSKTDAKGKATTYTYDTANRLATRTWARSVGTSPLVTNYSYSSTTGELTTVDYSDTTPDITA
jgi:YD repeat-containing protein